MIESPLQLLAEEEEVIEEQTTSPSDFPSLEEIKKNPSSSTSSTFELFRRAFTSSPTTKERVDELKLIINEFLQLQVKEEELWFLLLKCCSNTRIFPSPSLKEYNYVLKEVIKRGILLLNDGLLLKRILKEMMLPLNDLLLPFLLKTFVDKELLLLLLLKRVDYPEYVLYILNEETTTTTTTTINNNDDEKDYYSTPINEFILKVYYFSSITTKKVDFLNQCSHVFYSFTKVIECIIQLYCLEGEFYSALMLVPLLRGGGGADGSITRRINNYLLIQQYMVTPIEDLLCIKMAISTICDYSSLTVVSVREYGIMLKVLHSISSSSSSYCCCCSSDRLLLLKAFVKAIDSIVNGKEEWIYYKHLLYIQIIKTKTSTLNIELKNKVLEYYTCTSTSKDVRDELEKFVVYNQIVELKDIIRYRGDGDDWLKKEYKRLQQKEEEEEEEEDLKKLKKYFLNKQLFS